MGVEGSGLEWPGEGPLGFIGRDRNLKLPMMLMTVSPKILEVLLLSNTEIAGI